MALVPENSFDRGEITEIFCSVCIANYNGEEYIGQCIESVLNQDVDLPLEIIIHDDASTDNSVSFIKTNFPQVVLLESKENKGFCISNNRMVEIAKGENILLLNNDAALHQDALRTLQEALEKYGDGVYGLPQYNMKTGELIDIGSFFDPFLNPVPNKNRGNENVGMIIGACLFLPKALWEHLGGFPPWFGSLAEDMYICCLARLWGFPVKAIPSSGFDHWVGRSLGGGKVTIKRRLSTTLRRRASSEKNKTFVMFITYPTIFLWIILPIHISFLSFEGLFLTFYKSNTTIWKEVYWNLFLEFLKKRSLLKMVRQQVQAKRKLPFRHFLTTFVYVPHKFNMLLKYGIPHIR
jgi:GT2 family glycosyltransferase